MKLKKEVKIGLLIIVALILIIGLVSLIKSNSTDVAKFKREYEKLNGAKVSGRKERYQRVEIKKKNPVVYTSLEGVINLFKEKEPAVIFLGSSKDPASRLVAESLLKASLETSLDRIYYADIDGLADEFEVRDGEVLKVKEGDSSYQELLIYLDANLDDYVAKDEDGIEYESNYKVISAPVVFTIDYGRVVDLHKGALELRDGESTYDELNETQKGELFAIFEKLIESIDEE